MKYVLFGLATVVILAGCSMLMLTLMRAEKVVKHVVIIESDKI